MTALAPAFRSGDSIAGLNLNYRKCCWFQLWHLRNEILCGHGSWRIAKSSVKCKLFDTQNMLRTMIGPDGYLHRWTAHRKNFVQRVMNINASTKSLVERLCDFKIYAISVLSFLGSVCAPDEATLKAENHVLQCTTAGPYNAIPSKLLGVGSVCGLGPDLVGIHCISLAACYRVAACSTTLSRGLEQINMARGHNCTPVFALSPIWMILFVGWTVMTHLMTFHKTKKRRLPLVCFWTNFINKTLLASI